MYSAQGFTLIELLLVVVTLSVISVFSFAGFSDVSKIHTLKEAALNVESNLRFAHNQAINSVKPLGCSEFIDYQVSLSTSPSYNITSCGGTVRVSSLPKGTSFKGFIFYPDKGITIPTNNSSFSFLPTGEVKFSYLSGGTPVNVEAKSADVELIYGTDAKRAYIVNVQASGGTLISKKGL